MESVHTISVIIPTYNRKKLLNDALFSLARQTYSRDHFEVIVVDDGSTDGTEEIETETFPFTFRYYWQTNQGDAAARNHGAQQSKADFLVFLDDDILVDPGYLKNLILAHNDCQNKIVAGTWNLWLSEISPLDQTNPTAQEGDDMPAITELPFRDVYSNNMSLRREAYFKIGLMQSLVFPGSNMWCDLDFTYRAYREGFEFLRSNKAICWHRDRYASNPDDNKKRMGTASFRSVILFQQYPELIAYLPMFDDKTPINWDTDSLRLISRKLIRAMFSSRLILASMEQVAAALEKRKPASSMLSRLQGYIVGGYIYQGYRKGLREFGQVKIPK